MDKQYEYFYRKLKTLFEVMHNSKKHPTTYDSATQRSLENLLFQHKTLTRKQMKVANDLFKEYGGQQ